MYNNNIFSDTKIAYYTLYYYIAGIVRVYGIVINVISTRLTYLLVVHGHFKSNNRMYIYIYINIIIVYLPPKLYYSIIHNMVKY